MIRLPNYFRCVIGAAFLLATAWHPSQRVARADAISDAAIAAYVTMESTRNMDAYAANPDGGYLGWAESYVLTGSDSMYLATGNIAYMQRILNHADLIMANRADRLGIMDGVRNKVMPAWTTGTYTNGVPYAWEVHNGMFGSPIARASYRVMKEPSLYASYGERAERYVRDLTEMAIGFEEDWRQGPGANEGFYSEFYLDGATPPYNLMNAMGKMHVDLYLATGQQRFLERATRLATYFKNRLRLVGSPVRYDWSYSGSTGSEDISHAAVNVEFAFQCYQAGIVFTATDMQRFANTFLNMSRGEQGFTATVSGTGDLSILPSYAGMWGQLGYIDPNVRTTFYEYWKNHTTVGGVSWGSMNMAFLAATAQPMSFYSPAPQPSRQRIVVGMDASDSHFVPGVLGSRSSGYAAGSGWLYVPGGVQQGQSIKVTALDDPANQNGWTLEIPAGANPQHQSLVLDRAGFVGLWLRTASGDLQVSLLVRDLDGLERSTSLSLIADDRWHLYQWDFDDSNQWDSHSGGNGSLQGLVVSMQSLLLIGPDRSANIYLDSLETNVSGPIAAFNSPSLAGDRNNDGLVDAADYVAWRKDGGTVEEFHAWRANFGATIGSGSSQFAALHLPPTIPEPTSALLILSFAPIGVWRHHRGFHERKSRQRNAPSNYGHLAACEGLRS
jgi:hypothetical protein